MILCDFVYVQQEGGGYAATCAACGRSVRTKTTQAVASCRLNNKRPRPVEVIRAAGIASARASVASGPGTELKAILRDWLGVTPSDGCSCNSMAARMDALGADWCESDAGMTEILGAMRAEHAKRLEAGETRLPWTDFGATQLVRLACRRARAKAAGGD